MKYFSHFFSSSRNTTMPRQSSKLKPLVSLFHLHNTTTYRLQYRYLTLLAIQHSTYRKMLTLLITHINCNTGNLPWQQQ